MAFTADYALGTDAEFQQRIQMAIVSTAVAVQSEAVSTANHYQRSAYALRVLADPAGFAKLMGLGFTVNGATNSGSTDAALESRASAIWNAYSCQT